MNSCQGLVDETLSIVAWPDEVILAKSMILLDRNFSYAVAFNPIKSSGTVPRLKRPFFLPASEPKP